MAPQESQFDPESVLAGSFGRKVIDEARRMAQKRELPGQGWQLETSQRSTLLGASTMHNVGEGSNDPWKVVRINCDTGLMTAKPVGPDRARVGVVPRELSMQVRESGLVEVTVELTRGVHMRVVQAVFDVGGDLDAISFGIAGGSHGLESTILGAEPGPNPFSDAKKPRERMNMSEPVSPPPSCRGSASKVDFGGYVTHRLGFGVRAESGFMARVDDFGEDGRDSLRVMCPDQDNDPAVTLVRSLPVHFDSGPEALRWLFVEEIDRIMRDIPPPPNTPTPEVPPADAAAAVADRVAVAAG